MLNTTIKEMLLAGIAVFAFFASLRGIEHIWFITLPYLLFWVVRTGFVLRRTYELLEHTSLGYRAVFIYASLYFGVLAGLMAAWFFSSGPRDWVHTWWVSLAAVVGVIYGGTRFTHIAEQGEYIEEEAFRQIGINLALHALGVTLWIVLSIWWTVLLVPLAWIFVPLVIIAFIVFSLLEIFDFDTEQFGIRVVFTRIGVWIRKLRPGGDRPRRHRWRR